MKSEIEMTYSGNEEDLNLFLDGELPFQKQSDLYAHLAESPSSRSFMDMVMLFRRMSRQECIELPPVADERFFQRLAEVKASNERFDRVEDRKPLWNARRLVSVRTAIAAAVVIFTVGLLVPLSADTGTTFLEQEEERVYFDTPQTRVLQSYIYVYEPGLTIEAEQD
ncbi:MAG: hypothetical protein O3A57_05925 [Bacteroidetes bacterium]|nr:hypothetical protein [Bacteroidota bacterium]